MLFYDFEVFKYDWLVVVIDTDKRKYHVVVNDVEALQELYIANKKEIWVGYNSRHYDQYIFKAILCGLNPKKVNDFIIEQGRGGWEFSNLMNKIRFNNYDVMAGVDKGLKALEGFMGNDIRESSVPFNIDRKLTPEEIEATIFYCTHDVEQTIEVFMERMNDFEAQFDLLKAYNLPLSDISKSQTQLSAKILDAVKPTNERKDEFDIRVPDNLILGKYQYIADWFLNPENHKYRVNPKNPKSKKHGLTAIVAGVEHDFAWGGLHGARKQYSGEGIYLNMDVGSLYPSLMIVYGLMSRNVSEAGFERFKEIYRKRLALKHAGKKKEQAPLKLVLNKTYGGMKDKHNPLYDPRQANLVCVYGQLLLLDLIEKLESVCEIIQSNTDGILVKLNKMDDYDLIDDIVFEWEQRTGLNLEFDEIISRIYQKDVNNYLTVDVDGKVKSKGSYVKELSRLDNDLPIVNEALHAFMVHRIPVETTITRATELIKFQQVKKISGKYEYMIHGEEILKERCVRVFASTMSNHGGLRKLHGTTKKFAKVESTPEHAFLWNDDIKNVHVDAVPQLNKKWYIELAHKRLKDFGVI